MLGQAKIDNQSEHEFMYDAFISHSSRDRLIADALKHGLEVSSVLTWKAPDSILPGQIWEEAITDAISQCRVIILIWSSESQSSLQVKRELALAASLGKVIIPFRIEEIKPEGSFAYYLTNTHWLDAFSTDQESAILDAVERIRKILPFAAPKSGQEPNSLSGEDLRLEDKQVRNSLTDPISSSPSTESDATDSILIRIICRRLNEINLVASSQQNASTDPSIGKTKACDAAILAVHIPLSMRDSSAAIIQFTDQSLVVTIDDQDSISLPRRDLYAALERDQRIRLNAVSLITSKLSKDHLENLKECVNMWSDRYKRLPECEFRMRAELLRAYWNCDANSFYYPEVTSMAEILYEEEYGIEHFRKEPEELGIPIAHFYLENLAQSLTIYKDWIELDFSQNEPLRQFCFIHLSELNDFIALVNKRDGTVRHEQWSYFIFGIDSSLAGVLEFCAQQRKWLSE